MQLPLSLDAALAALSQRFKTCLFAEGNTAVLTVKQAPREPDLAGALQALARATGYQVVAYRNAYGLQKDYDREHQELPASCAEELIAFFLELERLLLPLAPPIQSTQEGIEELLRRLPPNLLQRASTDPIPLPQLPASVRQHLAHLQAHAYLSPLLRALKRVLPAFRAYPELEVTPYPSVEKIGFKTTWKGGSFGGLLATPEKCTSPFTEGETLARVVRTLEKPLGSRIVLAAPLARRPVRVFGAEYAQGEEGVRALAKLCGLELQKTTMELKLFSPRSARSTDLQELPQQIPALLPDPLRRYLTLTDNYTKKPRLGGGSAGTLIKHLYRFALFTMQTKKTNLIRQESDAIQLSAVLILSQEIMPPLVASFSGGGALTYPQEKLFLRISSDTSSTKVGLATPLPNGQFDDMIGWLVPNR